jgi:hypothetical protein
MHLTLHPNNKVNLTGHKILAISKELTPIILLHSEVPLLEKTKTLFVISLIPIIQIPQLKINQSYPHLQLNPQIIIPPLLTLQ